MSSFATENQKHFRNSVLVIDRVNLIPTIIIIPNRFSRASYSCTWRATSDRCWSMDSRFFPCPFLHKKILTASLSHGSLFGARCCRKKKHPALLSHRGKATPYPGYDSRCTFFITMCDGCATRTRNVGWWEPLPRVPRCVFSLLLLSGAREDEEKGGGSGRRNCTRTETPCGRIEKRRDSGERYGKRRGRNDPYGIPNGTDSSRRRKV